MLAVILASDPNVYLRQLLLPFVGGGHRIAVLALSLEFVQAVLVIKTMVQVPTNEIAGSEDLLQFVKKTISRNKQAFDKSDIVTGIFWSMLLASVLLKLWEQRARRALGVGIVVLATTLLAGLSARQIGIWRNSLTLFEYMIARLGKDPYRADIYWRLGVVQKGMGNQEKALESFNRALEMSPDDSYVHRLAADLYYKLDRLEEARKHYEAALRGDPLNAELLNGLGAVVSGQGDWVKASEYFSHALQINPDLPSANFNMGLALVNLGRKDEATTYFQRAERMNSTKPAAAE